MTMKHALIVTWSGFQDHEVVYPYYRLLGAGFKVSIVADKRDDLGRFYGILGLNMPCQVLISEFKRDTQDWMEKTDLLVLPGGVKSLEKLRLQKEVLRFIADWNEKGKVIASTCHGAQLLISARVVLKRNIAGYYSLEDDINNAGATYVNAPVVTDENIVSSPHYDFMGEWMEEVLRVYEQSSK